MEMLICQLNPSRERQKHLIRKCETGKEQSSISTQSFSRAMLRVLGSHFSHAGQLVRVGEGLPDIDNNIVFAILGHVEKNNLDRRDCPS
jgi:hypothetical protein